MSYWVYLEDEEGPVQVERFQEGGTQPVGGTKRAELNVTYNYSRMYSRFGFSLRDLDGLTGRDVLSRMESIVAALGTERDPDYWAPTPGNAGFVLSILTEWAA